MRSPRDGLVPVCGCLVAAGRALDDPAVRPFGPLERVASTFAEHLWRRGPSGLRSYVRTAWRTARRERRDHPLHRQFRVLCLFARRIATTV